MQTAPQTGFIILQTPRLRLSTRTNSGTQASLLIAQGVDYSHRFKAVGHAKVSTTLDIYSHVLAKSDERQATPWTICFTGNRRSDTIEARWAL